MSLELPAELVSPEELKRLADIHLNRYRSMLAQARVNPTGFRIGELQHLFACWEGVTLKKYQWKDLADEERSEVYDAVMSGE